MFCRIVALFCLLLIVGCGERKLTEEEKKKEWDRQAKHRSSDYKPSDGAFGAKDFAKESKEASERDTKQAEEATEDSGN
jgi:hypothetical protein